MSLFPELDRMSPEELRAAFLDEQKATQHGDELDLWLEEISSLLADFGDEEILFLLTLLPSADEHRLRAILIGLCSPGAVHSIRHQNEMVAAALALLRDGRPLIAAEAIELLRCLGYTGAHDEVLTFCNHSSPYVAGAVLSYLTRLFPTEAKPYLMEALASNESIVRQCAIDELDYLDCTEALPRIRLLLRDDDAFVRQAAQAAVTNLEELTAVAD